MQLHFERGDLSMLDAWVLCVYITCSFIEVGDNVYTCTQTSNTLRSKRFYLQATVPHILETTVKVLFAVLSF